MGLWDAISSGINGGVANAVQAWNVAQQKNINKENLQQQWDMWNATNVYNSPAEQMKRYEEAGLNPNLIYGQSNTTSPVDVGIQKSPQMEYSPMFQGAGSIIKDFMQLRSLKEDIRTKEINNEYLESLLGAKVEGLQRDNKLKEINYEYVKEKVETEGFNQSYRQLENQIKSWEITQLPKLSAINDNNLIASGLANDKVSAEIEVFRFSKQLQYMEYVLKNAQTEEALSRIGLNEMDKIKKLKEIDKLKSDIERINSQIMVDYSVARKNNQDTQLKLYDYEETPFDPNPLNTIQTAIVRLGRVIENALNR